MSEFGDVYIFPETVRSGVFPETFRLLEMRSPSTCGKQHPERLNLKYMAPCDCRHTKLPDGSIECGDLTHGFQACSGNGSARNIDGDIPHLEARRIELSLCR